ncbi:MAG: NlpC/P60 family protein, partial [SAR202 cluster bacterium]|nr:NlpC/P60 family protein [SAR202 cluster bacterium]
MKNFIINHHDSIDNELLDFYNEYSKKLREGILVLTNHKIQRISMPIENDHSNRRELITEALQWVGTPYRYGGNSRNGIDCSAYVQRLFRTQGVLLPRT